MQKRLIQRKRSRAASQGLNNSFSFSLGLQSKSQLEVDCNQVIKPFVGSSALAGRDDSAERSKKPGNITALIDISSSNQLEEQKGVLELKKKVSLNQSMDGNDSISRGGGIASKIGLAMSKIV